MFLKFFSMSREFSCGRSNPHIEFVPLIPEANDQLGALFETQQFMACVLPKIPSTLFSDNANVQVRAENFLQAMNRLEGRFNERKSLLGNMSAITTRNRKLIKLVGTAVILITVIGILRFFFRRSARNPAADI